MADSRRSLTIKVQIARRDLGLDDDTYHAMLEHLTGHRSSKDCTERQLVLVVAALRKRGWNPDWSASLGKAPKVRPDYEPLLGKIRALLLDTKKSWPYAESIAKKMYNVGISWCDNEQLRGVIVALTRHQQAAKRKAVA